jgi:hypothetical protein
LLATEQLPKENNKDPAFSIQVTGMQDQLEPDQKDSLRRNQVFQKKKPVDPAFLEAQAITQQRQKETKMDKIELT